MESFLSRGEGRSGIKVPEKSLACAPLDSAEGRMYFGAMNCAINVSFANRQVVLHAVREVFSRVFGRSPHELGMHMVYDVAHNAAAMETHVIDGRERGVLVHRKGATRALGPGARGLPDVYRVTGQSVLIGGSMETGSYLLAGTGGTEGSLCTMAHGSGRLMSRGEARRRSRPPWTPCWASWRRTPLSIRFLETRPCVLEAARTDLLLFRLLQEVIWRKDAERLLLRVRTIAFRGGPGEGRCDAVLAGEPVDGLRGKLLTDVKAVTLLDFRFEQTVEGWEAHAVLDV